MLQARGLRLEILRTFDGEPPSAFMSLMSSAKHNALVRITGGCAAMCSADAEPMRQLFTEAFTGFQGAILIGGTRMLDANGELVPGITEVGPLIRAANPSSVLLGVIPRAESLSWDFATGGLVIERSAFVEGNPPSDPSIQVIVQTHMDAVVALDKRLTKLSMWHDEAAFCARVTEAQHLYAKWSSALVVYNGGQTTEYEARLIADQKWPVILVRGSGRAADTLASDKEFLSQHRGCIFVCSQTPESLRDALIKTHVLKVRRLRRPSRRQLQVVS